MEINRMAGVAGLEPADDEIKTRCLTTWRHPSKFHHVDDFSSSLRLCIRGDTFSALVTNVLMLDGAFKADSLAFCMSANSAKIQPPVPVSLGLE